MDTLDVYNQAIRACQDEAFTLAVYLLGDDCAADRTVERACLQAYDRYRQVSKPSARLLILQEVVDLCADSKWKQLDGFYGHVLGLPCPQRQALLLVDLLGLTYEQAAYVLRCTPHRLSHQLANARVSLTMKQRESEVVA